VVGYWSEHAGAEAYQQSLALLRRCLTAAGFVASPVKVDNYARVWARDGVITGLAALASGDTQLIAGMERTLATLSHYQGPHGEIPSNVTLDGSQVSYGHLVGRVDALLWYVIGVCAYLHYLADPARHDQYRPFVERALFLAGCWEYNNRGLIYTPLAGNWADEYVQQGYVLSDQVLYMLALRGAGYIFGHQLWQEKAKTLERIVTINYWPSLTSEHDLHIYHPHAYRYLLNQAEILHWLPAFSPAGYATYFDGLAHALALLSGLGDDNQRQQAERYVQSLEMQIGSPLLPAFWPVILPGEPTWDALAANHLYGQMKNQPYMYHNGGLWPMVNGFYVLGLTRLGQQERARHLLAAINAANAQGNAWSFPEYLHGQTHVPMGTSYLAWSAAAGVLAHQAVVHGITPLALL
jgi:hypothetical protein